MWLRENLLPEVLGFDRLDRSIELNTALEVTPPHYGNGTNIGTPESHEINDGRQSGKDGSQYESHARKMDAD
jgi:hypothetical protein